MKCINSALDTIIWDKLSLHHNNKLRSQIRDDLYGDLSTNIFSKIDRQVDSNIEGQPEINTF